MYYVIFILTTTFITKLFSNVNIKIIYKIKLINITVRNY